MATVRYPALYQINTRVWLTELSQTLGRSATLDEIPNSELDLLAKQGFDWIWLLSVWQTGLAGQKVSRENPEWRREFEETLPDLQEQDIAGSGFAITDYHVHQALGGDAALARLRERLRQRGMKLMLDFVPNHTALDHSWVEEHPEYYIVGTEQDLAHSPENYVRVARKTDQRIFAHGRDPYFPGWPDTLQLKYANSDMQAALLGELTRIAGQCDGLRCDMAMLVLPEIFQQTWGLPIEPFWPQAIQCVRKQVPEFCFLAEVYWDREWTLQQQGFDYTYDKRLYDRLRDKIARPVREHLYAGLNYQDKLARFLENHDEPRAAAVFSPTVHQAAAVLTFLSPGLRFFQQGQLTGKHKRISPHLNRGPLEPVDNALEHFYDQLLSVLRRPVFREGSWQLLECVPAWESNWTSDCLIACGWQGSSGERYVVAVNYADNQSQGYVRLPFVELRDKTWFLCDLLGSSMLERAGNDLLSRGLYLDVPPWQASVFALSTSS
ncbi:MAG: alpha-amylase family glycosyl hydrolase [Bythopirellula sp.]|nr:alpha-amylase family glycosyl hydrolase [Bythopirellula sp.]